MMTEWAARFDEAMSLKEQGELDAATAVLLSLLRESAPTTRHRAAVLGELGGLFLFDLDDASRAAEFYQRCVAVSPGSELASLGLFHSLIRLGRVVEALDEMKRFISSHESAEYDALVEDIRRSLVDVRRGDGKSGGET